MEQTERRQKLRNGSFSTVAAWRTRGSRDPRDSRADQSLFSIYQRRENADAKTGLFKTLLDRQDVPSRPTCFYHRERMKYVTQPGTKGVVLFQSLRAVVDLLVRCTESTAADDIKHGLCAYCMCAWGILVHS